MCFNPYQTESPRTDLYPVKLPNKCIECGLPLQELYRTKPRWVRRLKGVQELVEHVWGCTTPSCGRYGQKWVPLRQTPPRSAFHFEVIFEVGRLRREEHKTFREISDILRARGTLIGRSGSCTRHVFHYYEIYELLWAEHERNARCQGQDAVLALDGVRPENGVATLYLATEAQSQEVLHSQWQLYSGTEDLVPVLEWVKALDLHLVGVVSDKQRAILLAVQEVFGPIPHQYCQLHWFQAAGKPLADHDRRLHTQLKKRLRKLRDLTRWAVKRVTQEHLPPHNLAILREVEPFVTVLLQAKNKPPFVFKGLQNWQRVKLMFVQLLDLLSRVQPDIFKLPARSLPPRYASLIRMARVLAGALEETLFSAWEVSQGTTWLYRLNTLLNPYADPLLGCFKTRPSKLARERVGRWLARQKTQQSAFLEHFRRVLRDQLTKWQQGLFVSFDYPFIPRTNAGLEQQISQIKQRQIKCSGRHNNHAVLRHQQCFQYYTQFPPKDLFLQWCQQLSLQKYNQARQRYFKHLAPLIKEYRIKRNFPKMLTQAFETIRQLTRMSADCT